MMRSLLLLYILIGGVLGLFAQTKDDFKYLSQFATVSDKDGYVNVRDENKKILGKLYEGEIFVVSDIDEPIGKYLPIVWGIGSDWEKSGYVHESRIKFLYQSPLLTRVISSNSAIFKNDTIMVKINIGTLDLTNEKVTLDPEYKYPVKINGYEVWGADCISIDNPDRNTEIKSIEYTINGNRYQFDLKDISGYLFPSLQHTFVSIADNKTLYISMNNGDAAGSYSVLWGLEKGRVTKKIVYIGF